MMGFESNDPPLVDKICLTCRFGVKSKPPKLVCFLNPPQAIFLRPNDWDYRIEWQHPSVLETSFCSSWQSKEGA